jgi:hypothetical protein
MMTTMDTQRGKTPAYFSASLGQFRALSNNEVIGALTAASQFPLDLAQRNAWLEELQILREATLGIEGHIFLEFEVPRLGSRIDAVLIAQGALIVLEFKCGADSYTTSDINQCWDYALDLKNFHAPSHRLAIFPVLVATAATTTEVYWRQPAADGVYPPAKANAEELRATISGAISRATTEEVDAEHWGRGNYNPSPTIIEAAKALYARHTVDTIIRHDAGARNLSVTTRKVEQIISDARRDRKKAIVFVTGVPGAGKTLVGLNVATQHRRQEDDPTHAVFLSGNGPLVAVLQEALTRDEFTRRKLAGETVRVGSIRQAVKPFIQNVHHFRDEGIRSDSPPADHVVIFDEAQRAWNKEKASDFMKRRKGIPHFNQSEAEFLIGYLDRHVDWAVVLCLVGGGQEIHTGEAGIASWIDAATQRFKHWQLHISPNLKDAEYAAGAAIETLSGRPGTFFEPELHLSTSMRSFRSENLSRFVKALLDLDQQGAKEQLREVAPRYPIAVTRDLRVARNWIRTRARGNERFGLVASSQASRLKPHAVDVRVNVDPIHWFLGPREDTRSSFYLEDAATEFQVQGLELDWVCVTWDADLRLQGSQWRYHSFKGDRWQNLWKEDRRRYLLNAYRVLLTRARQGMILFVPPGDEDDPTRNPAFYDETYEYLVSLGIPEVNSD